MTKRKGIKRSTYIRRRISIIVALCLIIASAIIMPQLIKKLKAEPEELLIGFVDKGPLDASNVGNQASAEAPVSAQSYTSTPQISLSPVPEDILAQAQADTPKPQNNQDAQEEENTPAPTQNAKTQEPAPTATQTPTPVANEDLPYYLYVEKGSFTLTIYEKSSTGEYDKVVKTYRIAHGGNKTPAGKFNLSSRERWHEFPDGGFVQYAVRYHARLYTHSPLYGAEDAKILWPKYYDGEFGIGKESTGGCLRMVTEAARFIYDKCPEGTVLEIANGSPKGTESDDIPSRNGKRLDPTDVNVN